MVLILSKRYYELELPVQIKKKVNTIQKFRICDRKKYRFIIDIYCYHVWLLVLQTYRYIWQKDNMDTYIINDVVY